MTTRASRAPGQTLRLGAMLAVGGMRHPPAFDGLQDRLRRSLTRERTGAPAQEQEGVAAEFTDHDTLLAEQLAERLEQRPQRRFAKPSGNTLMSRIAHVDSEPEPQTVRVQSLGTDYEDGPPTTPSVPAPHFSARQELAETDEWPEEHEEPERRALEPTVMPAPRLVAAIKAKRRQRFFSGLRNFASWIVTIGVAGSIIGGAALLFTSGRPVPPKPEPVMAVEAVIQTPTAPPTLVATPAPAERPAEPAPVPPAPRAAVAPPAPTPPQPRAATAPPPPAKLVKPIKQVQPGPKKGTAKDKAVVKASSPSPNRAPAARPSVPKDPDE